MRQIDEIFRWIPAVIAICSLVSLFASIQIDNLIHQTLYAYGLQFSLQWANPYWAIARISMAAGWIIVILALASQIYLIRRKTNANVKEVQQAESKEDNHWSTFKLGDGSTIKVKLVVKGAKRLNKYSSDGMPVYTVDTENIVRVVNIPEELKARPTPT